MRRFRHILLLLVLAGLFASCASRPHIIPRRVLTDIYAEMFLADQWLNDHKTERSRADTMLFYDPIFRRYGYTFEDYDASVRHYLKDPEKFSKVFRDAANKLKDKRDVFRRKVEQLDRVKEFNASIKGYSVKNFKADTIIWRSAYKDSLKQAFADSVRRDSLIRDSLRLDSLRRDSIRIDSLRRDSLKIISRGIPKRKKLIKNNQ
ncbi:MAG: DUF4296 domain-containing protein [Bacteroidales bacterium]|nr:DUF4296 domain-containing protein [Bacteroidales bacterium]